MSFLVQDFWTFVITIIIFGLIGLQRGWRREVMSLLFTLGGILGFILLGLGNSLANFIFVSIPRLLQVLLGNVAIVPKPTTPTSQQVFYVTMFGLAAIVILGYVLGNRRFEKPKLPHERLWGAIIGIITGYVLLVFVSRQFKTPQILVGLNTPSQGYISSNLVILIAVTVVLAVVAFLSSARKAKK